MISLIIPCYNEEKIIESTANRVSLVLGEHHPDFEIIFINDGSSDGTLDEIRKCCRGNSKIKCISFSRNFGHQPAISAGLHHAKGELAVILDADLQDPPELIPKMIELYHQQKCNVVYAVRKLREQESWFKKTTAKWFYRLQRAMSDIDIPADTGDFRLVDRKVMDAYKRLPEKQKYIRGLISWVGFKQVPIYYDRKERAGGETKFTLWKMLRFALTGLLYFSKRPLRTATVLGLICLFIGLGFIVYALISKWFFEEETVRGWTSLTIMIVFFGGVQLLSVGLLGEYIAGIFEEVKSRPEYIADEMINF